MAYYDTIRDPSSFVQRASGKLNFAALIQDKSWKGAASQWGRDHLFASRVLCAAPSARLPIFQVLQLFPDDPKALHPCLRQLIDGPGCNLTDLMHLSEPQIVQQFEPDSLGAATTANINNPAPTMPKREVKKPDLYGSYVQSHQVQFGSSSPDYHQRPPSSESDGSIGYVERLEAP
ncbi:hypothetical protein TARUN_2173 [Trichoderma arundinaceum]|uniref:Uncharacterized protein n=1 Tax=Trichoderma arundinaceum TaxID=490622 RepID=A0A395NVI0_TRIAR|nr:hypothetical protein TARUN_2173 [Trichoderma arundinaceum]